MDDRSVHKTSGETQLHLHRNDYLVNKKKKFKIMTSGIILWKKDKSIEEVDSRH